MTPKPREVIELEKQVEEAWRQYDIAANSPTVPEKVVAARFAKAEELSKKLERLYNQLYPVNGGVK
ncbi:MAG: hypothetical protein ACOYYF_14975 [Chloroflexota bacterium]